jgi:hypothetical protein
MLFCLSILIDVFFSFPQILVTKIAKIFVMVKI